MQNNAPVSESLLKTPLWRMHVAAGARMVPFAGYDMPVQYEGLGVLKEHLHTRAAAGLFDVSHMGQAVLRGDDPAAALERLTPGDLKSLTPGQMRYTVLLNDKGGIVDDLIVTRRADGALLIVVNAACKDKDYAYLSQELKGTTLERHDDRALVALQGPEAAGIAARLFPGAENLAFMTAGVFSHAGRELWISRSGYTGEDGFEISVPAEAAPGLAQEILAQDGAAWIGLGARDSLRLEAGLCLYGHDLDEATTPVEANLKWTIAKRRRTEANFTGSDVILRQLAEGPARLRVGLAPEGRAPVREGTDLFTGDQKTGHVTSGGFGPTVDAPVAMGYVRADLAALGTRIDAMVRGTARPCVVAALPFAPHRYQK